MFGQRRSRRRGLAGGLVLGLAATVAWPGAGPAGAGPAAPPPPPLNGPPPEDILATDPANVDAPDDVAVTAAATCPPAASGVHNYAPGTGKTVALTFDDGPGPSTEAIIRILQEEGVAATFFNVGVNMAVRPGLVRAESDLGFMLGNHTWDHKELPTLTAAQQASEMDQASAQQTNLVGSPPCVFRPPYGSYNSTTLSLAQARNMVVWNWSVDTEDWKADGSGSATWVNTIVQRAQAGGSLSHPVILLHNPARALPATVAALPRIIQFYRDRGYTFVDLNGRVAPQPVAGDWDGNGTMTPGVVRSGSWLLRNANSAGGANAIFAYGSAVDRPVVGDWDGNGTMTAGIVRGNAWHLRNANSGGAANLTFGYGAASDRPIAGDWDGNGTFTPGIVRGNIWHLRNANSGGAANLTFGYGAATDRPIVGDWDGNGTATPGIVRGGTWHLRNSNSGGVANVAFAFGLPTDRPIVGDWDGNGTVTPGIIRGNTWHLRNSNSAGPANIIVTYAP
jgi:peptidoglycan/xylan/chitin deacetylase (PgdA/CDA1 family)